MPLYIIPDRKVSLQDMQARMRDHFEDTPFNMTSDPGMGPDSVPYRWRPMDYTAKIIAWNVPLPRSKQAGTL